MKSPIHCLVLFLFCYAPIIAQEADPAQQEIDAQVWWPFIETYNALDGKGFNALHTQDVMRAGPWGIRMGEEYFAGNVANYQDAKKAGIQRNIAFRFEHRVARENVAYEVGYYKVISKQNGVEHTFYGRFDVVLRKVEGTWRIAQDWDVDAINGRKFTEEDFVGDGTGKIYKK